MNETQAPDTVDSTHVPAARRGPRLPMWARLVVAALGMLASALASGLVVLPVAGLGLASWVEAGQSGLAALGQVLLLVVITGAPSVAALLLLWGLARLDGLRLRDYLGRPGRGALRFAGYAAAVAVPTLLTCLVLAALGADGDRSVTTFSSSSTLVVVVTLVGTAVLTQGIPEELWFRGLAFVTAGTRPWATLIGTTLAFTILHLVSQGGQQSAGERIWYLILPLGMGFLAGCARWCTGSVWAAAGTHSGLHLGMIPAALLAMPTGPWAWTVLGILQLGAGAVLLRIHRPWINSTAGHQIVTRS